MNYALQVLTSHQMRRSEFIFLCPNCRMLYVKGLFLIRIDVLNGSYLLGETRIARCCRAAIRSPVVFRTGGLAAMGIDLLFQRIVAEQALDSLNLLPFKDVFIDP